ncbi:hypothetical protein ARMSODRAFT_1021405 [Armillaria solidipes]|uniref:Uncharacterized protein n=1 Tax=Armillaria solidipes TaxID=1076256 RepID=A0A2H3BCG8_9AGAR|nr:hypothetical protein ARMSODRAFT_1021405 [Armillaria solidipes]
MDTAEERRTAHNASSRRSYAKHRDFINQKRKDAYKQKKGRRNESRLESPIPLQAVPSVETEANGGHSYTEHCPSLTEAMEQINSISASFIILTMGSPKHYADTIYQQFVTLDFPQGLLDSAILDMSSFEQSLLKQERVILHSPSITGGSEMGRLRAVLDPVRLLAGWLEEMIYEAMVSPARLREKYLRKDLAFLKDD